jgi:hypothetical protein
MISGKRLPDPPDAENFKMCWVCGLVVPLREIKQQGKIAGIKGIELISNPYDRKDVILGIESKNRYQRLRKRQSKHPDKEVQRLINQGWELQSYQTNMQS